MTYFLRGGNNVAQHARRNMLQDLESLAPAVPEVLLPEEDVASVLTLLELAYGEVVTARTTNIACIAFSIALYVVDPGIAKLRIFVYYACAAFVNRYLEEAKRARDIVPECI